MALPPYTRFGSWNEWSMTNLPIFVVPVWSNATVATWLPLAGSV